MNGSNTSSTPTTTWYGPWLVALGAALWGTESAWRIPLNKIFSAEVIVFHEHVLIVLLFLPVIIAQRRFLGSIPLRAFLYLLFSGVAGSAVGAIFFTLALKHGNPSVVNVLLNVQPVFSTIIAYFLFREKLSTMFFIWAPIAILCGIALSIEKPTELLSSLHAQGISMGTAFALLCALFWGCSTVAGRGAMLSIPAPLGAGLRAVIGLFTLGIILLFQGKCTMGFLWPTAAQSQVSTVLILFLLLATISGGFPTYIYFLGLTYSRASTAGYFEMMQTLAALMVTWVIPALYPNRLIESSPLRPHQIIAGILLIFAVVMVQRAQRKAEDQRSQLE